MADANAELEKTIERPTAAQPANLDVVMRIPVAVKIVLGSVTMPVANLIKLGPARQKGAR